MTHPSPVGDSAPPVCYRHRDRVAYVRCQRCERPICPECQRPAAVGVQCPECVAQGKASVRPARSVLGAPLSSGKPVVTITIIVVCVALFILQQVSPGTVTRYLAFVPAFGLAEPWTFLTTAFLHVNITHILFNMYALWVVGSNLEQILGRARFIALYLVCALGGSVAVLLLAGPGLQGAWVTPTVGASGAIFGLFGTIVMVTRRLGQSAAGIYLVIGINVAISFLFAGISWQGHLGGLATGFLIGGAYAYAPKKSRGPFTIGVTAAVVAVLVGLIVWKYSGVPPRLLA